MSKVPLSQESEASVTLSQLGQVDEDGNNINSQNSNDNSDDISEGDPPDQSGKSYTQYIVRAVGGGVSSVFVYFLCSSF